MKYPVRAISSYTAEKPNEATQVSISNSRLDIDTLGHRQGTLGKT
jgi:hypothetical protein